MTPAIMFVGGVYGVRPDRNDKYDVTAGYFATPLRVKKPPYQSTSSLKSI